MSEMVNEEIKIPDQQRVRRRLNSDRPLSVEQGRKLGEAYAHLWLALSAIQDAADTADPDIGKPPEGFDIGLAGDIASRALKGRDWTKGIACSEHAARFLRERSDEPEPEPEYPY